jgi:hypothetical protein
LSRFLPKRARPPFITLAVEPYSRRSVQIEVITPKFRHFLHARPRVVKEEEKSAISQRIPGVRWKRVKERGKFLPFQKLHLGRSGAFDRNQRDLLAGLNHLWHSLGEVFEESTERCQPLIPSPDVVVPIRFQMNQETLCTLEREVLDCELCNPFPKTRSNRMA